nr:DUF943 family protein [uncultured Tolumonas sp.]
MKKIILLSLIGVVFLSYFFWSPTSIVNLYNSENDNGSYIVTIRMAPRNMVGAIQFWLENKKLILNKTNELNNGKYILFVKNEFENKSDEDYVQLCLLKQIKNNEKCINYSNRLFTVTRRQKNGVGLYSLNQEDVYLKNDTSCLFFDYDNGNKEYLGCDKNTNE